MKKALLSLLLFGVVAGNVGAYEVKGNPDRKMSIGVNYNYFSMGGDTYDKVVKLENIVNYRGDSISGDVRIPISSMLTFTVGGSLLSSLSTYEHPTSYSQWDMNGYNLSIGFRVYIP